MGCLIHRLAKHELVVLEGADGTGKSTLAAGLASGHGYAVLHSGRPPDGGDLAGRFAFALATPGLVVLDRSFISELVYGTLRDGRPRLSARAAAELALQVADRGGILVHLTGSPDVIAARLTARDGFAPPLDRIRARMEAYHAVFAGLAGAAPIITADTTR